MNARVNPFADLSTPLPSFAVKPRKQETFAEEAIARIAEENNFPILHVIEGYIGDIKLDDPLADNSIVRQWIDRLLSYRPVKDDQIETVLLHLNDLPGVNLHAVLEPMQATDETEGATPLILAETNALCFERREL
jgi:hypothetical protein